MANNKEAGVKKYQLDKLKVVKVTWLDAMSDDNTWQDLKELSQNTFVENYPKRNLTILVGNLGIKTPYLNLT